MLSRSGRGFANAIFGPLARILVKLGVSADVVTVTGTVLVCLVAVATFLTNHLFVGAILIGLITIFDSLDGQVARISNKVSRWGAFLDSTIDRIADGTIFASLLLWALTWAIPGLKPYFVVVCLIILIFGTTIPYARARAEGLGFNASIGIAERADRLFVTLVAVGLIGLGIPQIVLLIVIGILAIATAITVVQRMAFVYKQGKPLKNIGMDWEPTGWMGIPHRNAARIVVFDKNGKILLVQGRDFSDSKHEFWFLPGGGRLDEESPRVACARELYEETGYRISPQELVGPVLLREAVVNFKAVNTHQSEVVFMYRWNHDSDTCSFVNKEFQNLTEQEKSLLGDFKFWDPQEIFDRCNNGKDVVYPECLPQLALSWVSNWDNKAWVLEENLDSHNKRTINNPF